MFGKKKVEVNINEKDIDSVLGRGIINTIIPSKEDLKKKLISGERLRFYWGFDATGPQLHLGHAQNFMLLEDLRKLGHEVIVLFGDFTALIGDPTDKKDARSRLSRKGVMENVLKWKKQMSPLIGFDDKQNPPLIKYNSKWLAKLTFEDVIDLAANFTVQQMVERDMFERRLEDNKPIYLHEFFYPLMQGYDSVAMDIDVECGGTDQTFNMLAGRTLLKKYKNKEKFVIAVNLQANPITGEMMSKSKGIGVFLDAAPEDMYGAIMAQPDEMTEVFYVGNTRLPLEELEERKGSDPKEFKMFVAKDIVERFFGAEAAERAEADWQNTFSKGGVPEDVETVTLSEEKKLVDVLVENEVVSSKTEFKRLVDAGAIKFATNDTKITDQDFIVARENTFKVGKRRFIKIEITP